MSAMQGKFVRENPRYGTVRSTKDVLQAVLKGESQDGATDGDASDDLVEILRHLGREVGHAHHDDEDLERAPQERHEHVVKCVVCALRL